MARKCAPNTAQFLKCSGARTKYLNEIHMKMKNHRLHVKTFRGSLSSQGILRQKQGRQGKRTMLLEGYSTPVTGTGIDAPGGQRLHG